MGFIANIDKVDGGDYTLNGSILTNPTSVLQKQIGLSTPDKNKELLFEARIKPVYNSNNNYQEIYWLGGETADTCIGFWRLYWANSTRCFINFGFTGRNNETSGDYGFNASLQVELPTETIGQWIDIKSSFMMQQGSSVIYQSTYYKYTSDSDYTRLSNNNINISNINYKPILTDVPVQFFVRPENTAPFVGEVDLEGCQISYDGNVLWTGGEVVSSPGTRIQLRHDTASNWTAVNPLLLEGEVGIETDTGYKKVGNGTDTWNNLPYEIPIKEGEVIGVNVSGTNLQIADGILTSDFTEDIVLTDAKLDFNSSFTVNLKIRFPNNTSSSLPQSEIFHASYISPESGIPFQLWIRVGGQSWHPVVGIFSSDGTHNNLNDIDYVVASNPSNKWVTLKFSYNAGTITTESTIEGGTTQTNSKTGTIYSSLNGGYLNPYIVFPTDNQYNDVIMYDLNNCYIEVDGKEVWRGIGPVKTLTPLANSNQVGLVRPDNRTIQIDSKGIITAIPEVTQEDIDALETTIDNKQNVFALGTGLEYVSTLYPNNLASNSGIYYSSYENSYYPYYAFDGNSSTYWGPATAPTVSNPCYITRYLGQAYYISEVTISYRDANEIFTSGEILGSNDNSNWTSIATFNNNTNNPQTHICNSTTAYSYIKLQATSASGGYGKVGEMNIYYQPSSVSTLEIDVPYITSLAMPDYSAGVSVSTSASYTAPSSGVIYAYTTYSGNAYILVNGQDVWMINYFGAGGNTHRSGYFLVSKNDVVTFTNIDGNATFFPMIGAN